MKLTTTKRRSGVVIAVRHAVGSRRGNGVRTGPQGLSRDRHAAVQ